MQTYVQLSVNLRVCLATQSKHVQLQKLSHTLRQMASSIYSGAAQDKAVWTPIL